MTCNHHQDENPSNCIEIVPIFSNLTEEEMLEIANITTEAKFEKGSYVYMANDLGGKLYVLHSGRVKISRLNINGKEQVLRIVEPGEFMGELTLLSNTPLTDNAEVLEKTLMCMIDGNKLKELMNKYPSIAFKVMEVLSKRLEQAESLIEKINLNTVEQRLASALLDLVNSKNEITLNMTKGDFASSIGMSQETLSRKLTSFQDEGIIELIGQRKIIVKNINALKLMCE
ncbi:MAG TPA: Crp/Fnr family transcriptional regulator [Erysipelotrichaceae bacterium]|nr:Crp/Fnr family transcriptional regulator [Erysipelotrichaceae bacterium]